MILGPLIVPVNENYWEEEAALGDCKADILEQLISVDNHVIEETLHHSKCNACQTLDANVAVIRRLIRLD